MTPKLALTIVQVLCGLILIAVVMLQSGKSAGLSGAIAGGVDTFLSKNKAKTWDSKLAKLTKWVALLFVVLTLVLSLILGNIIESNFRRGLIVSETFAIFFTRPISLALVILMVVIVGYPVLKRMYLTKKN